MFMKRQVAAGAGRDARRIQADVIGHVEVDVAVAIVVAERAAGAPMRIRGLGRGRRTSFPPRCARARWP
jgi:hypothetical protein